MKKCFVLVAMMMMASAVLAGEVKWMTNFDEALVRAKKEKKLVMVDVYTDWCGWCKKLDKDVYSKKEVIEKLEKDFIAVKLNPEKSQKNRKIAGGFDVNGYPTIIFVGTDGKQVDRIGGYVPAEEFLKKLNEIVSKK